MGLYTYMSHPPREISQVTTRRSFFPHSEHEERVEVSNGYRIPPKIDTLLICLCQMVVESEGGALVLSRAKISTLIELGRSLKDLWKRFDMQRQGRSFRKAV